MHSDDFVCYLCGARSYIQRKGHARDAEGLVPLECTECGLVALSSLCHIGEGFYEDSHMHDSVPCDPALELLQGREDSVRRFSQFKADVTRKRLLDVGCGAGGFLLEARSVAASVTGVEPELALHEHFAAKGLRCFAAVGDVPHGELFDVITMFHVLEHLHDPVSMLRDLRSRLDGPAAQLVVEVPSASDALLTLYDNDAFSRFTYWSCHLYLFTPDTLQRTAERAGLRLVRMQQFQRYPLANHLHWLAQGKPGGHYAWAHLSSPELDAAYAATLAANGLCDTIIGTFSV